MAQGLRMNELKVGSTVWYFDPDHREYRTDMKGCRYGPPIYRAHFRPTTIIAETSRSWIIQDRYGKTKIPKATLKGIWISQEDVDKMCWVQSNRYSIYRKVEHISDYDILQGIAVLVNYTPEESQ